MDRVTPRAADLPVDRISLLADPGSRLAAVTLDAALPFVPQLSILGLGIAVQSADLVRASGWVGWGVAALVLVVDLVLLARYGQTIGKRIVGIRIVRTNGERASLGRLFVLRTLLPTGIGLVPIVGFLFGAADTLAIFSTDRRTLHDRIADTIVIDLRAPLPEPSLAEVFS
jgi:uncharacterized RDD family membrane protein YckC